LLLATLGSGVDRVSREASVFEFPDAEGLASTWLEARDSLGRVAVIAERAGTGSAGLAAFSG
jgi:hypothetical protein